MLNYRIKLSVAVSLLLCFVWPAYGHAILLSASPGLHEVIKGPNVSIKLKFNARIDVKRSRLVLVSPDAKQRTLSINEPSPPDSLRTDVKGLTGGSYILRWQVLANDGHITRGEVPFVVQ